MTARQFSVDFSGRIRNFDLPRRQALLPLFEAVVNSLQAIEDAHRTSNDGSIEITVNRLPVIDAELGPGEITGFTVTDNGVGFDGPNFESFLQSDSQMKASRGGKGIGRFCWLKAFDHVDIDSTYREGDDLYRRKFTFSLDNPTVDDEVLGPAQDDTGTTIYLCQIKREYLSHIPDDDAVIGERIMQHCLVYLLDESCPEIDLVDGEARLSINEMLNETLESTSESAEETFTIKDNDFHLLNIKMRTPDDLPKSSMPSCRLILCANNREVTSENITDLPAGLSEWLVRNHGFVYVGVLTGEMLDTRVSTNRLSFDIPDKAGELLDEVVMPDILGSASASARAFLKEYIAQALTETRDRVEQYVTNEAPQYRHLLTYESEGVAEIGVGATDEAIDDSLYKLKRKFEKTVKTEGKALVRKLENSQIDSDQYQEEFARQVERVSESNQAMLAEYVVHRRAILNIFKAALNRKDDGKFNRESFLHELIYPMRATSDEVAYQAHNLWLIDERLTFSGFIASDKPFGGEAHEQRPDIMCLDHAVFVSSEETDGLPYDTVTIFELKRPGRDDYNESNNPITQLLDYAGRIRSNQERDANGRPIRVNENTRMCLYTVCDITQSLQRILDARGYGYTADGEGRTSFNSIYNAYIEVLPFDKIYRDATMRNKVFFKKLGID
jgi:hypothetical protein